MNEPGARPESDCYLYFVTVGNLYKTPVKILASVFQDGGMASSASF